MVLGLGADLVELARMERLVDRLTPYAARLVFAPAEVERLSRGAAYAAGRFAVKEALLKAAGVGFAHGLARLGEIETREGARGAPVVVTTGRVASLLEERGVRDIHVTISHERTHAVAVVILIG